VKKVNCQEYDLAYAMQKQQSVNQSCPKTSEFDIPQKFVRPKKNNI